MPTKKKPQHTHKTGRFHLDRRVEQIKSVPLAPDDTGDDLLTTREVAVWLGVSTQWLEIGRSKNYGPPFVKIGPSMIRYRRSDVLAWLDTRTQKAEA